MCVQDSLELQWHFDCKSRQLRQVQNQILETEAVNRKLQEDIDFMKKHSPLLEEQLNLEGGAVKNVLLAYEKVNTNNTKMFLLESFCRIGAYPFREQQSFGSTEVCFKLLYTKTANYVPIPLHTGSVQTESRENNAVGL